VTGAAVAAITERVQIRAGSVVLPLHHPLRVAEEWSVVDNISRGRVGISFAPGWQPNDFVLRPESFADAKGVLMRDIDVVRRLWRGESLTVRAPNGKDVELRTLPRPVQPELPFWLTTAGTPESFTAAGKMGANLLTHLLGQSVEELAGKIALYRQAWAEAGHPGAGHVSLMLHTFVGQDDAAVKELVRRPLTEYLRTSIGLIKQYAATFPTLKNKPGGGIDFEALSTEEMEALLAYSFERYYETSGLFGTLDTCTAMVERLEAIDVDEIACLIDFGVATDTVLAHLDGLNALRERCSRSGPAAARDHSVASLIARHGVTHMQCTPSMAGMLLADRRTRGALRGLRALMIGGEAFPPALAAELRALVRGAVHNMYGPTETTIWSATYRLNGAEPSVPIGRPIANTELYVVDAHGQPLPPGVPGELLIGGAGVVRGYLGRPELTADRFIADRFKRRGTGRLYRTGDLARWRPDGQMEFLGRLDHQVKIRGYRVELGEIEALLERMPAVREAVVIAREDVPGDKRLVAYVVPRAGAAPAAAALRDALRDALPEYMVPAHVVMLAALPRTPNAKIDRKALPAPDGGTAAPASVYVPPGNELEQQIASIWQEVLQLPQVGMRDNFFDLGGHSLLAVQVHGRLRERLSREVSITDLFRFPTIRALTDFLEGSTTAAVGAAATLQRAEARREAMLRRRSRRN
jgi:natural product biosynthesis luciferase-like monooxygenase protein